MHIHHDNLFEVLESFDYERRIAYIQRTKPIDEQPLRLRLLRMVLDDKVPGATEWDNVVKAWDARKVAIVACDKLSVGTTGKKLPAAYWNATAVYSRATITYLHISDVYFSKHKQELEVLHKELCPDCPWDGKTIFTRKNEKKEWY